MLLCFGVLGSILRECKLETVGNVRLIGTLTRTVDPSCEYINSEGSTVSRLLSCQQNLSNGQQRRINRTNDSIGIATNRLSNVVSAAQNANVEAVKKSIASEFFHLLDEDKKNHIVPALRAVICADDSLDTVMRLNFQKYYGCPKEEFLRLREYSLVDVLSSTLLFTCAAVKNTAGKAAAKLIDHSYVLSCTPNSEYMVTYETASVEAAEVAHNTTAVQLQIVDETPVIKYLQKVREKHASIKTLLYKAEPVPFYNFYVCNDIQEKIPVQSSLYSGTEYKYKTISSATAALLCDCSRFVIIAGSGGIGKSMMMRHLLLDAIDKYVQGGSIPVFIPVRDYGETLGDLLSYVYSKIEQFGTGITKEFLLSVLNSGRMLFLLDGLDEIGIKREAAFENELEAFIDRYPGNQYIISSRPHRSFVSYSRFSVLQLKPFTKKQALSLIENLDFRTDMPEIKRKFIKELDGHLFSSHYGFASNPLLLTIMLMTFERYAEVPSKMHIFYKDAFDTLAKEHDAAKAYSRPLKTGLPVDRFEMYFAEFCSRSYHDEKFEFTESEFVDYYDSLTERNKDTAVTSAEDFLYDARANLCLMFCEGGKYLFSHRSFQEYFCAFYFSKQKDKNLKRIGSFFEQGRSRNFGDQTFNMLYDMIPTKVEEYIFKPFMRDLLNECTSKDGYWSFLETMYPTITFENGETDEVVSNTPSSYIYEFMREKFFPVECDCAGLPEFESLVVARYCYIEERGITKLVNESDIPYDYRNEYGDPEEVGRIYDIDVHDVRKEPRRYRELLQAMDDDSFVLKREYAAASEYLAMLTESQIPRGDGLFDLFV